MIGTSGELVEVRFFFGDGFFGELVEARYIRSGMI